MKTTYTPEELVELLRQRQGNLTLKQFAAEIGLSFQFVSDVLRGTRSVGNDLILEYLAPKGKRFDHRDTFVLVDKG